MCIPRELDGWNLMKPRGPRSYIPHGSSWCCWCSLDDRHAPDFGRRGRSWGWVTLLKVELSRLHSLINTYICGSPPLFSSAYTKKLQHKQSWPWPATYPPILPNHLSFVLCVASCEHLPYPETEIIMLDTPTTKKLVSQT
jgi:hypothetical protein